MDAISLWWLHAMVGFWPNFFSMASLISASVYVLLEDGVMPAAASHWYVGNDCQTSTLDVTPLLLENSAVHAECGVLAWKSLTTVWK